MLGKDKPIKEFDPDYEKPKHYIIELEDHLAEAQKQSFPLAKRHKGWLRAKTLDNYCLILFLNMSNVSVTFWWIDHAPDLGQALVDFGKAIKDLGSCENAQLEKVFSELGFQSELLSCKQQKQVGPKAFGYEELAIKSKMPRNGPNVLFVFLQVHIKVDEFCLKCRGKIC